VAYSPVGIESLTMSLSVMGAWCFVRRELMGRRA